MTRLYYLPNEAAMDHYRSRLSGERIGWAIHRGANSFSPVHRIYVDPLIGPVIVVADEVWEVDPETDEVFASEEAARDAFWAQKET